MINLYRGMCLGLESSRFAVLSDSTRTNLNNVFFSFFFINVSSDKARCIIHTDVIIIIIIIHFAIW